MIKKIKRFLKTVVLPDTLYLLFEALFRTTRVVYVNFSAADFYHSKGKPIIALAWHGRIIYIPPTPWNNKVKILVSPSEDGDILVRYLGKFGFQFVRGSSRRGGEEAKKLLLNALKEGYDIFLTPDGPTGPPRIVKPGAIELALLSGSPIFLIFVSATRGFQFKTWDKFCIPLPFSKVYLFFVGPYIIRSMDDLALIQEEMVVIEKEVDWIAGRISDEELLQIVE